jgi:hypothetical protein
MFLNASERRAVFESSTSDYAHVEASTRPASRGSRWIIFIHFLAIVFLRSRRKKFLGAVTRTRDAQKREAPEPMENGHCFVQEVSLSHQESPRWTAQCFERE